MRSASASVVELAEDWLTAKRALESAAQSAVLHDYFAWATMTTMARYHRSADDVPDGLRFPQWSWDGLVGDPGHGTG